MISFCRSGRLCNDADNQRRNRKALEMDGLLKDAGQYAAHYEGEPAIEQTEEPPLTADDVQNLVLIDREYIRGTRTTVYDLSVIFVGNMISCNIRLDTMMTEKALPFIRRRMIFGNVCRSLNWHDWRAFLSGKHYILSTMIK